MLKKILRSILFVGVLLILLIPLGLLLEPKDNTEEAGMYLAKPNQIRSFPSHTIELLLLGDSEAQACFSPLDLWDDSGIPGYVCSAGKLKVYQLEELLETTLSTQKPKVIIFETNTLFRDISLEDVITFWCERRIPVFRYHDRWKSLSITDFTSKPYYTASSPSRGLSIHPECVPAANTDYMISTEKRKEIPFWDRFYFEKILEICRENGMELIAFSSPSPINWTYEKHNAMVDYTAQLEIPYLDGNVMDLGINWSTDTMDKGDHLNYFGARKVTAFFSKYLRENYDFVDYREDLAYAQWNMDAKEFHKQMNEKIAELEEQAN